MRRLRNIKRRRFYLGNMIFICVLFLFLGARIVFSLTALSPSDIKKAFSDDFLYRVITFKNGVHKSEIKFTVKNRNLESIFDVERDRMILDFLGYLFVDRKDMIFLRGNIDFISKKAVFSISSAAGELHIDIVKEKEGFSVSGSIRHLKIFGSVDVVANLKGVIVKKNGVVKSELYFKDLIIDYLPFDREIKLNINFDIRRKFLYIQKFNIGMEIQGYGNIAFSPRGKIFLKWYFKNLKLRDYIRQRNPERKITGLTNGSFVLKGELWNPHFLGHLNIRNGSLGLLKFDSLMGDLEGKGPHVFVKDSVIFKDTGYMRITGKIDLNKLSEGKAFDRILLEANKKLFSWNGWSIVRKDNPSVVKLERFLGGRITLRFKRHVESTKQPEDSERDDEFELNYRINEDESFGMKIMGEKEFVGVEHKMRF